MAISKLSTIAILTALTLGTSGCIIHVGPTASDDHNSHDYSSVFSGVDVDQNKKAHDG